MEKISKQSDFISHNTLIKIKIIKNLFHKKKKKTEKTYQIQKSHAAISVSDMSVLESLSLSNSAETSCHRCQKITHLAFVYTPLLINSVFVLPLWSKKKFR